MSGRDCGLTPSKIYNEHLPLASGWIEKLHHLFQIRKLAFNGKLIS